jgi:uncharacterized cupredoxin-like copper-binding protein
VKASRVGLLRGLTLGAGLALMWAGLAGATAASRSVEIAIRYSHFSPSRVVVAVGVPVTFILRNDDPIDHEWIVGDEAVHAAHRTGSEPFHAARPTEVSVPPLATRTTTVTFAEPGPLLFICHLPGHEAYGMVGSVKVVAQNF